MKADALPGALGRHGRATTIRGAFLRAAAIVLLCHVIPATAIGAWGLYTGLRDRQPSCTECGAFDGLLALGVTVVVGGSIGVGLLLAMILVAAGMRRPLRVGLIAGATGILLSLASIASLVEWLTGP